jgi:hypothetical protein
LLETGRRFQRFDQLRQRHFWSMAAFTVDANGYIQSGAQRLFITPPGQAGQGFPFQLTERETNWKSANRVPDNQNFEVLELGVTLMTIPSEVEFGGNDSEPIIATPKQCNNFGQNTVLAIQYLTNEVPLGLCSDFAQAAGPQMGSYQPGAALQPPNNVNNDRTRYQTNGFASPGLRRRLKVPILLQHGETFSFNLLTPRTYFMSDVGVTADTLFVARIDFWATESFVEKS